MNDEVARQRFLVLNVARLSGLILVMLGAANVAEKLLPEYAPWFGGVLMFAGVLDFFVVPTVLKQVWQKQGG
jgi:hypothetical protein